MTNPSNGLSTWQAILVAVASGIVVGSASIIVTWMNIRHERRTRSIGNRYEEARKALILLEEDIVRVTDFITLPASSPDGSKLLYGFLPITATLEICLLTLNGDTVKQWGNLRREVLRQRIALGTEKPLRPESPEENDLLEKTKTFGRMSARLRKTVLSQLRALNDMEEKTKHPLAVLWKRISPFIIGRY